MEKSKILLILAVLAMKIFVTYGKSKKDIVTYWAAPNTPVGATTYQVGPPRGIICLNPNSAYVCQFSSSTILAEGDYVNSASVEVISTKVSP